MDVLQAQVTLSSAQLLSMGSSPGITAVTVVAAQGAGKIIYPLLAVAEYDGGSAAYVDVNGDSMLTLSYASIGAEDVCNVAVTGFLDSASAREMSSLGMIEQTAFGTDIENSALKVYFTDNVTTGNGTLTLTVYYVLMTAA